MQRLADLDPSLMDAEQRRLFDVIASTRAGGLGGPFSVLIRTPHIADAANSLHNAFRLDGKLDRAAFEMLILLVAGKHKAAYAWKVHEALARRTGLAPEIIRSLADGVVPQSFQTPEQKQIFEATSELLATGDLTDQTYESSLRRLGTNLLIEVIAAIGFYSMVCLILNSFRVPEAKAALVARLQSGTSGAVSSEQP